jgi:hypothetical protein
MGDLTRRCVRGPFDHQPGLVDPGVPDLLLVDGGVGGLGEQQTDRHRLVVADDDLISGHARQL